MRPQLLGPRGNTGMQKALQQPGHELGITPHCFRLGGASNSTLINARDLAGVQRRVQARSFTSGRCYDKSNRVGLQLQRRSRFKDQHVFLDVFAGKGGMAKAIRRRGYAALSIDVAHGDHHDW